MARFHIERRDNVGVAGRRKETRYVVIDSKTGNIAHATKDKPPYYGKFEAKNIADIRNDYADE